MSGSGFGTPKYSQINFNDNSMIVTSFAIAATIAFLGAIFAVHLSILLGKALKIKYDKFLIG